MRHCYVLRVFTRDGEGGNHLGVVPDVTGLDSTVMQRIAADLGFSETVFIDWREEDVPGVRIFTPASETPFAGHPLVGAGWVLNKMGPGVDRVTCGIGPVTFQVEDERTWITVPGGREVRPVADPPSVRGLVAAADVFMPVPYRLVEVEPAEVVAGFSSEDFASATYVWAWQQPGSVVKARFFAPDLGVDEDPGTGSAAVALAEVLRFIGTPSGELVIHQGDEIGSPCTLHLAWGGDGIRVGGAVTRDEVRVLEV